MTGCTGLIGNREIMVNPPLAGALSECSCRDNWSLYNNGTCAPPACFSGEINRGGSCSVGFSGVTTIEPSDASVVLLPTNVALSSVANAAACGGAGGWYYDNAANPTRITLCPASCTQLNATTDGSVSVNIGCHPSLVSTTVSQVYDSQCPADSGPVWMLLTWDTLTPGDSNVAFRARTAATEADLATSSWAPLGTAQANPDTQVCPLLGGPAGCPIDLYAKLGGKPAAERTFLELQITMNPTSDALDGPTVNGWEISYSCRPNQ
jgi:hypothetical protein